MDKIVGKLDKYFDGFRILSATSVLNKLEKQSYGVAKTMTPSMLF